MSPALYATGGRDDAYCVHYERAMSCICPQNMRFNYLLDADAIVPVNGSDGSRKTYPVKSCLTNHKRLNSCNRPYMCQDCDKSYATAHQFKQHVTIDHDDGDQKEETKFECQQCGKILPSESKLIKHMAIHRGIKQAACFVCFKSFTTKAGLRQHVVVHSGVKPFHCVSCDKSFWWKGSLVSHSRSHLSPIRKLRAMRGFVMPYDCDDWIELSMPRSVVRTAGTSRCVEAKTQ